MAVKFSEFTEETVSSNITGIVGYISSSETNIRIAPSALNTSYDLTATDNAANNVPLVLTGSDSTTDTVNFVGTGTVTLSSTGNVITIDAGGVTSFTNANGTYVSAATENTAATGAVTTGIIDLSAIDGTSDLNTRFLSKDNTWDVIDRVTGSGTTNIVPLWTSATALGDSAIAQSGTNIGIGTTSPSFKLELFGGSGAAKYDLFRGYAWNGTANKRLDIQLDNTEADPLAIYNATKSGGAGVSHSFQTDSAERLRITSSGNVGIGTSSPSEALDVKGNIALSTTSEGPRLSIIKNDGTTYDNVLYYDNQSSLNNLYLGKDSSNVAFRTGGSERMRIDSSGNFGFNETPENSSGTWRNFEVGGINIVSRFTGNNDGFFGTGYLFKTDNSEVYKNTEAVSRVFFNNDTIEFQQAASGTAGTAISWGIPLKIDSSGNVGIGISSPSQKLDVSGSSSAGFRLTTDGFTNLDLVSPRTSGSLGGLRLKQDIDTYQTGEFLGLHGGGFDWKTGDGSVAPSTKMSMLANGNVGIGTTPHSFGSGFTTLEVKDSIAGILKLGFDSQTSFGSRIQAQNDDGLKIINTEPSAFISFTTVNSEKMRITSGGQVKFNSYTSAGAFTGTAVADLAVDSSGNIITKAASGALSVVEVVAGTTVAAAATTLYVFTASSGSVSTLTLPASPTVGDTVKISNIGGLENIVGANTNNIMGVSTDMTIDVATSSFELVWTGISATGWVILSNV